MLALAYTPLPKKTKRFMTCNKCGFHLPLGDFANRVRKSGNIQRRLSCIECIKAQKRLWNREHPNQVETWAALHPERYETNRKEYREAHRTEMRAYCSAYNKVYFKENKALVYTKNAKRRATKVSATFGDPRDIQMWYEVAEVLTRGGVKFEVDHIVPLLGRTVTGFHAPWNLTVIPKGQNASKGNNYWPDKP